MKNLCFVLLLVSVSFFVKANKSFVVTGSTPSTSDSSVAQLIDSFSQRFAPDKRTAIFQIDAYHKENNLVLTGRTNLFEAKKALISRLQAAHFNLVDEIKTLPESKLEERTYGLVEVSVCNIRYSPRHSGELASQALMGTPIRVLEKDDNGWLLIQTPDQYISWVDRGAITTLNKEELTRWQNAPKIIYTRAYGAAYTSPSLESETVSDLVAGCVMELKSENNGFYEVIFPDNRTGFVAKNEANSYNKWLTTLVPSEEHLAQTAKRLMGVPYLWGGTSFKGVDCSGFTKTVYFLNGILLPRDASQQVMTGETVDKSGNWENLKPGDLLFFGEKREDGSERVVHVALWLGNGEFIHASDKVRINSMLPTAPNFNGYELKRYLRAKRILQNGMKGVSTLKADRVY